jgi:hypothetical protein
MPRWPVQDPKALSGVRSFQPQNVAADGGIEFGERERQTPAS